MIVLDTGALIALERRKQRMVDVWRRMHLQGEPPMVPGVVIAEWWRGRTRVRESILDAIDVVPVDAELGRAAGDALAEIEGSTVVDAIVMALAARHSAIVYTSDVDDLEELRAFFPGVRVLSV